MRVKDVKYVISDIFNCISHTYIYISVCIINIDAYTRIFNLFVSKLDKDRLYIIHVAQFFAWMLESKSSTNLTLGPSRRSYLENVRIGVSV